MASKKKTFLLPLIFGQTIVTGYCLYLVEISIRNSNPFSNQFYYPHFIAIGLTSSEIRVMYLFPHLMLMTDLKQYLPKDAQTVLI